MSVLLFAQGQASDEALVSALHAILLADCQAQPVGGGLYRTHLPRADLPLPLGLLWRFEPAKAGNLRLSIRPELGEGAAGGLRVDCQRGFVDLLRAVAACNRDKNRTMSFVLSEYSYVEVVTMFPAAYLKDLRLLRRLVKNTLAQLPPTLDRLLAVLRPFLEEQIPREDAMGHTAQRFLSQSYKLLLLAKRGQLERAGEEEAERRLEEFRLSAFEKLRDALRMMGSETSFLRAGSSAEPSFSEWTNRNKDHLQSRTKEKNVFSVKLLAETRQSVEKDTSGSHCRILLATYLLTIAFSVSADVVQAARDLRTSAGAAVVAETTKELQLVKKEVKSPLREQSRNSFQNQLDFILFIRDRNCKFVSTYYWQYLVKREKVTSILMEYYPHNLREMLQSQGKLLSFREKLLLLKDVTAAVSWLAGNYICHRDIKPENIMVSQGRLPKLVDFGSCCSVSGGGHSHLQVSETRLLGTAGYFRAFGEEMSLLYKKQEYEQHMLFDAYSLGRVMRDVLEEGVPQLLPNLHSLVTYVIDRCEEQDPADRLTYEEMLFLFEVFLQYLEELEGNLKE